MYLGCRRKPGGDLCGHRENTQTSYGQHPRSGLTPNSWRCEALLLGKILETFHKVEVERYLENHETILPRIYEQQITFVRLASIFAL